MAIMSGCDYLPSVPGVGCKTAHRSLSPFTTEWEFRLIARKHRLMRRYRCARKAIQAMRLDAKLVVPRNYDKEFERADFTFQHQIVYDVRSETLA